MNIEELKDKFNTILDVGIGNTEEELAEYFFSKVKEHTKLSIEFAISVLEELHETISYFGDTWWELQKIEEKIQELKTYLKDE